MSIIYLTILCGLLFGFAFIIWNYAKGLKDSPIEIWLLFLSKLIEYAAYGASNMTFVLYLSSDCGLGDIAAGSYIGTWSMLLTSFSVLVGAVVDAIGIKKTLILGMSALFFGRLVMPFTEDILIVTAFAFIPVAIGNALIGPVLSVGIKKFTNKSNVALGFGLFYTMMNIGFALGGYIFDKAREVFGEHTLNNIPFLNVTLSTYQIIFFVSFLLTIPSFLLILYMKDEPENSSLSKEDSSPNISFFQKSFSTIAQSSRDTINIMKEVFKEKNFWEYIFLLGILVFIKLLFYHFHYTFPKYGIRILGEGTKIGNLYGILNPVMIIFLVPIIAHFTKNINSYTMLGFGTLISASSIFLAVLPPEVFRFLQGTWIEQLIFVDWLQIETSKQNPLIYSLSLFIIFFTIGEAIWSPRLMQFSTEIAPEGKEGTYLALSYLPYFLAKMFAGPLSGWLIVKYAPLGQTSYPDHYMIWIWIGGIASLSPIGLLLFRKQYTKRMEI